MTVWNATDGRNLLSVRLQRGGSGLAFSPDGKILALAIGPTVQYWNLGTGQGRIVFERKNSRLVRDSRGARINHIAFAPNGRTLGIVVSEGVILWDVNTECELGLIRPANFGAHVAEFSPDGKLLALVDGREQVSLWDVTTRRMVRNLEEGEDGGALCIAFSPDGALLAGGLSDHTEAPGRLVIWDTTTGKAVCRIVCHSRGVGGLTFFPTGRLVATTGGDGTVKVWRVASLVQTSTILEDNRHALKRSSDFRRAEKGSEPILFGP